MLRCRSTTKRAPWRASEYRINEGLANIRLALVMLRRELWDEALERVQEMLPRFRDAGDAAAQTTALLGIGLAQRGLENFSQALATFAEAAELARAAEQPLSEAEALHNHASVLIAQAEVSASLAPLEATIERVERALTHLDAPTDQRSLLGRWVALYSGAVLSYLRTSQDARAQTLAFSYAQRAGASEIGARLKAFEESLTAKGQQPGKEQQEQNKALAKRISDLRKRLK
jgi:tetratricopeptide (TPR) repeat protein